MRPPRICVPIVDKELAPIKAAELLVDLFEVRIDLIGVGWPEVAGQIGKPWIACNRRVEEGGRGDRDESKRLAELLRAVALGAAIVDIELETDNLKEIVPVIKDKAECLISYHNLAGTPPLAELKAIVRRQIDAGADIGKVVTTARHFADNLAVMELIKAFPEIKIVSFAMGDLGVASRILGPLIGGEFTYASVEPGRESAAGQLPLAELRKIYEMVARW